MQELYFRKTMIKSPLIFIPARLRRPFDEAPFGRGETRPIWIESHDYFEWASVDIR